MDQPVKISFYGLCGVGKSSLVLQLTTWKFPEEYDPTIWDSYKMDYVINEKPIRLDLMESASNLEEHSVDMRPQYMRASDAIVVVPDLTILNSGRFLDDMRDIFYLFDRAFDGIEQNIPPIAIWANKSDLFGERRLELLQEGKAMMEEAVKQNESLPGVAMALRAELERIVEVSAKTRDGLDSALQDIVLRALRFVEQGRCTGPASTKLSGNTRQIKKTHRCVLS